MSTYLASVATQSRENFLGVFAERGHATHARGDMLQVVRRKQRRNIAPRRFDASPPFARGELWMLDDRGHVVHHAHRDVGALEQRHDVSALALPKARFDGRLE